MSQLTSKNHKQLHIQLIGVFLIRLDGVEVKVENRSARRVLAWLSLCEGNKESRNRLASVLWPENELSNARRNLRQAVFQLRRSFELAGFVGLQAERESIALLAEQVATDVDLLLEHMHLGGAVPEILLQPSSIVDSLLAEFVGSNDLFYDWITLRRMDVQRHLQEALNACLHSATVEQKHHAAKALQILDPADEVACRALMRSFADQGKSALAIRVYDELQVHLAQEFDLEPSAETQQVAAGIKAGSTVATTDVVVVHEPNALNVSLEPLESRPCIEIAEFDLEAAGSFRPVLRAMRGEIMTRLSKFREWRVSDGYGKGDGERQPDFLIRGVGYEYKDIGQLSLSVLGCKDNEVIWSETFRNMASQWNDILVEVASQVSAIANNAVSQRRLLHIVGHESASVEGFDAWLVGQRLLARINWQNWREAEELLSAVVKKEPNFTRAYSVLARIKNTRHLAFPGYRKKSSDFEEALRLANLAISTDPLDCQAHLCRAWSLTMQGDYSAGADAFEMARNLNQYDPWTTLSCALGCAFRGEKGLALQLAERSLKMGWTTMPLHWGYHGTISFLCGNYEECISSCRQATDVIFNIPAWHAAALVRLGRLDEAHAQIGRLVALCSDNWMDGSTSTEAEIIEWVCNSFPIQSVDTQRSFSEAVYAAWKAGGNGCCSTCIEK